MKRTISEFIKNNKPVKNNLFKKTEMSFNDLSYLVDLSDRLKSCEALRSKMDTIKRWKKDAPELSNQDIASNIFLGIPKPRKRKKL